MEVWKSNIPLSKMKKLGVQINHKSQLKGWGFLLTITYSTPRYAGYPFSGISGKNYLLSMWTSEDTWKILDVIDIQ